MHFTVFKPLILILLFSNCNFNAPKNYAVMKTQYKYMPDAASEDYTDWVTFIEPDTIVIERTFKNKESKMCSSNLFSTRGGNAWSAEDIKNVLSKEAVERLFKNEDGVFVLAKAVGGEGKVKPFLISRNNISITILPPGTQQKNSKPAKEDVANMVYVLTRIYRQQLLSNACLSLNTKE